MADIILAGSTSGAITISAPAISGTNTLTLPAVTDTLVGLAATQTLTNKSIAATQLTGTVAAARLPAGSVVQVVNYQTGAMATGATTIPNDDTIPQITEGNQYMSLAITPTSATNLLVIDVVVNASNSSASDVIVAVFRDATANAIAVGAAYNGAGTGRNNIKVRYQETAGSTSATTLYVRAGGTGTTTFNGSSGTRTFGGTYASSITIQEITV